jgi:hypothetical protein
MTGVQLRSVLESFRDGECPAEAAIDAIKEEGAWPWRWEEGGTYRRLVFRDGLLHAWVYPCGEDMPNRLEVCKWFRERTADAGFIMGTVYGPPSELCVIAETIALRCLVADLPLPE